MYMFSFFQMVTSLFLIHWLVNCKTAHQKKNVIIIYILRKMPLTVGLLRYSQTLQPPTFHLSDPLTPSEGSTQTCCICSSELSIFHWKDAWMLKVIYESQWFCHYLIYTALNWALLKPKSRPTLFSTFHFYFYLFYCCLLSILSFHF